MRERQRWLFRLGVCALVLAACALEAHAFYPYGYFHSATGQLIYPKWRFSYLDRDGSGDIDSDVDGIEMHFEGGATGFTQSEKTKIAAGLETWENVPTSYIAFTFGQDINEPMELAVGLDVIDLYNMIALETAEDVAAGRAVLPAGVLGLSLLTAVLEDSFIEINGATVPVSGGQFLDVDLVYSADGIREIETTQGFGFRGGSVTLGGYMIGIGMSPMLHINEAASDAAGVPVENRLMAYRDATGTLVRIGMTPSMSPAMTFYDEGNGVFSDSKEDLAPDDIAAVTFLYPRSDLDAFFDLSHQARTRTQQGFASQSIAGGHIVAWCDVDNVPSTARVPFIDTLTGLYERDAALRGQFVLRGLFKQLETLSGVTFQATYAITCEQFTPDVGGEPEDYDSTHGGFLSGVLGTAYTGFGFSSSFPSEVFRESTNMFGIDNVDQGTPLAFDPLRRKIISANSSKSLDQILAAGRPMFGDANQVCPLNVVIAGMKTHETSRAARAVRDGFLLQTAAGTALVDAYYRTAPTAAAYLLDHPGAFWAVRTGVSGMEWTLLHKTAVLAGLAALVAVAVCVWLRRVRAAGTLVVLFAIGLLAIPAGAQFAEMDIPAYVKASDDIVTGTVKTVDSHWTDDGLRIVTDVTVEVADVVKGRLNKSGKVHFELPTGRVGAIARFSPQLPSFDEGEEVLLFLEEHPSAGYMVVGGASGKFGIRTDESTGEKTVRAASPVGHVRLYKEMKGCAAKKADDPAATDSEANQDADGAQSDRLLLDEVTGRLRDIVREQKRTETK